MPHTQHTLFEKAHIHVGELAGSLPELIAHYLPEGAHTVCDVNTQQALAHRLEGIPQLCFNTPPHADMPTVNRIRRETMDASALIALGSGTINDLCKYASFLEGKPYLVIATAPSMNGYVSANASISEGGYKKTLPAHAPQAVLCDLPTLATAPPELIQAGIGDTLCRSTVQADWLLSHLLTESAYEAQYFDWLRPWEQKLFACAGNTQHSTLNTSLTHALLLSGLAMRHFGSSAPASQGEHLIAHAMEMLHPQLPQPYHGQAIAVTSLHMARRQEEILQSPTPPQIRYVEADDFAKFLPESLIPQARLLYARKFPNPNYVTRLNKKLQEEWEIIRTEISAVILPANQLQQALEAAGCPTSPKDLSWPNDAFAQATHTAPLTRDRLTFLDVMVSG